MTLALIIIYMAGLGVKVCTAAQCCDVADCGPVAVCVWGGVR